MPAQEFAKFIPAPGASDSMSDRLLGAASGLSPIESLVVAVVAGSALLWLCFWLMPDSLRNGSGRAADPRGRRRRRFPMD